MRVLHTGDLHLDGAFCRLGGREAEEEREQSRALLENIFKTAVEEKCSLILIAGDLFDGKFVSKRTGELFCDLVMKSGITVAVSPGNHDFYFENSFYDKASKLLGDRLVLFTSSELQAFELEDLKVKLYGYAFTSPVLAQNPLEGAYLSQDGYMHILCAHADLSSPLSKKAPLNLAQLRAIGFDYAALGHIHNAKASEDGDEGRIRYCGFPEGRGFDELGEGGVWIVDIEDGCCTSKRVRLSSRAFYILKTDISLEGGMTEAEEKLSSLISQRGFGKGARVRIILEGEGEALGKSELDLLCKNICSRCSLDYAELVDRRFGELDGELLSKDATLKGELYRVLHSRLLSENEEERALALKALKIGLAAIEGKSVYDFCD